MSSAVALPSVFADLVAHLSRTTVLTPDEVGWVIGEVLRYLDEPLDRTVRRRHRELQADGLANAEIWRRLADELRWLRVAPPTLTERQLRRLVYG